VSESQERLKGGIKSFDLNICIKDAIKEVLKAHRTATLCSDTRNCFIGGSDKQAEPKYNIFKR